MRTILLRNAMGFLTTVLLGGFLAATLVRLAPGFDVDESQLDPRLGVSSVEYLRQGRQAHRNIVAFYMRYWRKALHGDLGESQMYSRPVSELIRERAWTTVRIAGMGLAAAWVISLGLAIVVCKSRKRTVDVGTMFTAGTLLSVPAAAIGLLTVMVEGSAAIAIALIVSPRLYRYCRNLLACAYELPHILAARARGISETRILLFHALPSCGRSLLALGGVSVSIAIGAAIPVEALCNLSGIGQLAWQSALARDLPLLVTITILVTVTTLAANSCAEIVSEALHLPQS